MFRSAFGIIMCLASTPIPASSAPLPLHEVTADGTWDCKQPDGTDAGAVVIVEKNYAFIKPDGRLGGYGKLFLIVENFDLPHFAIISGFLKDKLGSHGFGMRGPRATPHDLSGELYLNVIFSAGGNGELDWDCVRRKAPGV